MTGAVPPTPPNDGAEQYARAQSYGMRAALHLADPHDMNVPLARALAAVGQLHATLALAAAQQHAALIAEEIAAHGDRYTGSGFMAEYGVPRADVQDDTR